MILSVWAEQMYCVYVYACVPQHVVAGGTVLVPCGLDIAGRDGALLNVEPRVATLFKPASSKCWVHVGHKELT